MVHFRNIETVAQVCINVFFRVYYSISFSEPIDSNLIICVAINSLVADKAFAVPPAPATLALNTANTIVKWIPTKLS